MSDLSIVEIPTAADVLGTMHYSIYRTLKAEAEAKWADQWQKLTPIIQSLAKQLQSIIGDHLNIEYHPPEVHHVADTCGTGPHIFFLRLPVTSQAMKTLPRLLRRRTAIVVAVGDLTEPYGNVWVKVAVSRSLNKGVRDQVRSAAAEYVRHHITAPGGTHYQSYLGFENIGQMVYCGLRTQLLRW